MHEAADLKTTIGYTVPYLWLDARRGRERFALDAVEMPVSVRGVLPGSLRAVHRKVGFEFAVLVHEHAGRDWVQARGYPIASLGDPREPAMTLGFCHTHLPAAISPGPAEIRRGGAAMRAAAIEYPGEAAAARVMRIVADDLIHDGTYLYVGGRRAPDTLAIERDDAVDRLSDRCCAIVKAGDQAQAAGVVDADLAGSLARLRRVMPLALLRSVHAEDIAQVGTLVRDTARILSQAHPKAYQRRRMAGIANAFDDTVPADDIASFESLVP